MASNLFVEYDCQLVWILGFIIKYMSIERKYENITHHRCQKRNTTIIHVLYTRSAQSTFLPHYPLLM
jgi:hypothetical protein